MVGLDADKYFTPIVEKVFGPRNVIVVKYAYAGMPICFWDKSWMSLYGEVFPNQGVLYDILMDRVFQAIDGIEISTVSFVWMQGETDALLGDGFAQVYEISLIHLMSQLKTNLGRNDIGVIIGRISDYGKSDPYWEIVRYEQVHFAEHYPNTLWVNTDDLNGRTNDPHLTDRGYRRLGKRFAKRAIRLIRSQWRSPNN